jgi:acyl carrier protein
MAAAADIYPDLASIFADVFMRDDLDLRPELTARQVPGWDSFKQIEIILACEERWSIKFSTRELDSLLSVGDLMRVIERKTSGG